MKSMENKPAGSMLKSEPDKTDPRSSNSTSEEKYKMEHAPDGDYQHSSSTSESEDDMLEGEVTYTDGCPDTVPSSFREKLNVVWAEHEALRMQNMAESQEMLEKLRAMIAEFEEVQKRHMTEYMGTYEQVMAIAADPIRRLEEIGAILVRERERFMGMEEIPKEEFIRFLERMLVICNRPA